jgi:hypothetical protein
MVRTRNENEDEDSIAFLLCCALSIKDEPVELTQTGSRQTDKRY